jgi:hypothetical protein
MRDDARTRRSELKTLHSLLRNDARTPARIPPARREWRGDPPDIALHHAIQEFALELSRSLDSQVLLFGKFHLLAV